MFYEIIKFFVLFFVYIHSVCCSEISFLLPEEYKPSHKDLDITFIDVDQGDSTL